MNTTEPINRPAGFSSDNGSALLVVLSVTFLLSLLVAVSFSVARQSINIADSEEEYNAALAAAEAGLDDYMFRLNDVDGYWQFNATNAPPDGNLAFTQFVPIPGGETATNVEDIGMFTYTVDASELSDSGIIWLEVIGCAPGPCTRGGQTDAQEFRTIQSSFSLESFLDYVYFTDYETSPPVIYPRFGISETQARADCSTHRWEAGGPAGYCTNIRFVTGDVIDGPFHTNDTFLVDGAPRWTDVATSSDPNPPHYNNIGSGTPIFDAGPPTARPPLNFPSTNLAIRFDADHIANPASEGCLFTGPTEIILTGNSLRVRSPQTKSSGSGCGTWPRATAQTIAIPANGVIFVQDQPTSGSDPNQGTCSSATGNGLGYPWNDGAGRSDDSTYPCGAGDAFVEGTLDGRLTIASERHVFITWDVLYAGSDDMLGLIANDLVQIYHPTDRYGSSGGTSYYETMRAGPNHPTAIWSNPTIEAALLSVQNSFMVQNYEQGHIRGTTNCAGRLGTITINGAIAQRFRGPVGTSRGSGTCTGYAKNYGYDPRLRFINPPSFIDPVDAIWRISRYSEETG